jgi:hypothetical protein
MSFLGLFDTLTHAQTMGLSATLERVRLQRSPSNGKTCNEPTSDEDTDILRPGLQGAAKNTDESTRLDSMFPSYVGTEPPSSSSTKEAFDTVSRVASQKMYIIHILRQTVAIVSYFDH